MGKIVGIRAIQEYLGRSEATVMDAINHAGLPAVKEEGIWIVKSQAELDRWNSADPNERRGVDKPQKTEAKKTESTPKSRQKRSRKRK